MTPVACLRHHAASQPDALSISHLGHFETWQIPLPLSILLLAEGPDLLVLARDASSTFNQLLHQSVYLSTMHSLYFEGTTRLEIQDAEGPRHGDLQFNANPVFSSEPPDPSTTRPQMRYRMGKWAI